MRVLFISKPVVPPWNDGSKNLVRDVSEHLTRARPTVMVAPGSPPLGGRVREETVYGRSGGFAPSLRANAGVLARLLAGDPLDVWHFVFAPNRASSGAAWVAKAWQRARGWKGRVVQTIASVPRSFEGVSRLLFGDVVIAQSEHTRARLLQSGASSHNVFVIPPCAIEPSARTPSAVAAARARIGDGPLVLYPGDLETSRGARMVVDASARILREVPEARIVLACRRKTERAVAIERSLAASVLNLGDRVCFLGDVPDMHALLHAADVIALPCEDLYGKVDIPLVVIEALSLGKPLVLARGGPLEAVSTAAFVDPGDAASLATEVVRALDADGEAGRRLYAERFSPSVVARAYDDLYERA